MTQLIEPLIPALRRYARSFLKNSAAADDLVQDTLLRAISRWRQRRSDGDARSWLYTILHNLAVTQYHQTARRGDLLPLNDAEESDVSALSTHQDGLRRHDILAAVNRLPDDQRSVLLLVSVEDLSYAEVARVLDVPIGAVMSRLAQARARLLQLMDEDSAPASGHPYLRRVQ